MADIKTIAQKFETSSSLSEISSSLSNTQLREDNLELKSIYILKQKIDELVAEVNKLKNQ